MECLAIVATELEEHRHRNMDKSKIEQIQERIRQAGVEYIYYNLVTVSGRVIAKAVPAKHLLRNLEKGIQFHRTAMSDLQSTRAGKLLGGGVQAAEITALPDLDTFNVLPWDKQMASFFCTAYEPEHIPLIGGSVFYGDVRAHLKKTHQAFMEKTGLELRTGCEPEMSWIGEGIEVKTRPGASPAYHMGSFEIMRPIYKKVMEYATAMGLDMIEGDYEDPTQLELNWLYDCCDKTADRLILYRLICRQVAKEFGVIASFMPKPYTSSMGNGCHHNFSLWRGDENVLMEEGRRELHLTDIGKQAVAGILEHAPGSMMIMASTVNSYKRFWDTGLFAPSIINWGMDNKSCSIRLSGNGRLEFKTPDASVNPYLSHTLILAAIQDGMDRHLDPGAPDNGDSRITDTTRRLPLTLGDAIVAFDKDTVMFDAFPLKLSELYRDLKADEWARYCSAVTSWEFDMYLEYLP